MFVWSPPTQRQGGSSSGTLFGAVKLGFSLVNPTEINRFPRHYSLKLG